MKRLSLVLIVACVSVAVGCGSPPRQDASGIWTASFGESQMRIQLDSNEYWCWWVMQEASYPKSPSQEGRWFIHDGILVLRVEKSESCKLPPGLAFTFDVRSVTADCLTLYDRQMETEIFWKRLAN